MTADPFDLPDGHRTVELRALAARPGTRWHATHRGVVLANTELKFGGVYEEVDAATLRAFLDRNEFDGQLLFVTPSKPSIEGLHFEEAFVFGKAEDALPPSLRPLPTGLERRTAQVDDDFSFFDDETMTELYAAARRETVHVVAHRSQIVAAAYAAWRSERFADVSVDTVEAFRGWGLAAHAAYPAVCAIEREGRQPVWGALMTNIPSLRLARRLGFSVNMGPVYLARYPAR
jgi:hypothetical protein